MVGGLQSAVALGSLFLVLACGTEFAAAADADSIQGEWEVVSVERGGAAVEGREQRNYVVKKGTVTVVGGPSPVEMTYEINESTAPKTLDLAMDRDGNKVTMPSIYKLDGDTLVINSAAPGEPRPTDFTTTQDGHETLVTLKRVVTATKASSVGALDYLSQPITWATTRVHSFLFGGASPRY